MVGKKIIGYQYSVMLGENEIKATLDQELNDETAEFVAGIEFKANEIIESMYTKKQMALENLKYGTDLLQELYFWVKENQKRISVEDVMARIDDKFKELQKEMKSDRRTKDIEPN